ncbi:MAG: DUF3887 domain-containing protein, partial [Microcystis sp. M53603_WE2]|nr:DUF3887 domain-containing protein [Microcystis sp. M53603_WE2]
MASIQSSSGKTLFICGAIAEMMRLSLAKRVSILSLCLIGFSL